MLSLPLALAPAFAAALALQHLVEIIDAGIHRDEPGKGKKFLVAVIALVVACIGVALYEDLGVMSNMRTAEGAASAAAVGAPQTAPAPTPLSGPRRWIDILLSGLIISAGTEGFNSILKFLSYKKDETKSDAQLKTGEVSSDSSLPNLPAPALG